MQGFDSDHVKKDDLVGGPEPQRDKESVEQRLQRFEDSLDICQASILDLISKLSIVK